MSTTLAPKPVTDQPPRFGLRAGSRVWLYVLGAFVLVSAVRVISGAHDMDSIGTLRAALISAMPIALAGLGGLWSERAGVVNIGLEGMMIAGTLGAAYFGYHYGWVAAVLGGMAFGAVLGILHAFATVIVGVDHIVSGVAINIIALGLAGFLAEAFFSDLPGGGPTQSPPFEKPPTINIPAVTDWAQGLEDKQWLFVSDAASVIGALTKNLSWLTIISLGLVAGTAWLLWKTPFGLRLRSCGEAPSAAESLGVHVLRYKFLAVCVSGMLAGLGGAYLSMVSFSGFQNGQTGGRGYIGLAAMIFGNWRPGGMLMGAGLFGYTDAMQLRGGGEALHAILLLVAIVLVGYSIFKFTRGQARQGVVNMVLGLAFLLWYLTTDVVPREFTAMAPYLATLLVLAFASQKLRMPAADGQVYRKGSVG